MKFFIDTANVDEIKKAKPEYEFSEIVNNLPEDNKK